MDGRVEDLLRDGCVTLAGLKSEFGIGRSHAYELMSTGALPYTTAGCRRRLVPRRAVRELLAQHLVPTDSAGR